MRKKINQINDSNRNIFLMVCFFIFSFLLICPKLYAQTIKEDTCDNWQSIIAKVDDSTVALKLSTADDGQKYLKWTDAKGKMVMLDIYKAKGPINEQGIIEVCTKGKSLCNFKDSYSIAGLQKDENLFPGYYAFRVIIGYSVGNPGESSDWIAIQIE